MLARARRHLPRARRGARRPSTDPYLDLGAGEVVGAARLARPPRSATQLDEPLPRRRAPASGTRRASGCSSPFLRRRDWHWLGLDGDVHNWNPWIHGNVLVAALALMDADDPARARGGRPRDRGARPLRRRRSRRTARSTRATPTGGTAPAARSRRSTSSPTRPAARSTRPTCPRSARRSPSRTACTSAAPWYLNLADGPARPPADQPWHALHRAARRVGDADAAGPRRRAPRGRRAAGRRGPTGLGRLLRGMTDAALDRRRARRRRRSPATSGCRRPRCCVARAQRGHAPPG